MPQFASLNFFNHQRKLPSWFWDGKTDMACLKHAITQSLQFAYAHHIQRLMITGNFALLAGIHPDEVDAWYLGIYIDALEWVEITNTRGMSQFADGGLIASKPYISGGSYINKMSHYCTGCKYKVNQRTGPESCPFNALYWNFLDQHRDKLGNNHRLAMPYKTWDKMAPKDRTDTLERAAQFLNTLEEHTAR
jgi:deoxyribodipyrimidine photolyase-related protein